MKNNNVIPKLIELIESNIDNDSKQAAAVSIVIVVDGAFRRGGPSEVVAVSLRRV